MSDDRPLIDRRYGGMRGTDAEADLEARLIGPRVRRHAPAPALSNGHRLDANGRRIETAPPAATSAEGPTD